MINLVFSPVWFHGYDIIFEILAVLATFFIGIYSYKLYRFSKNYRHQFLALSFWALSLSFLAKIATNFVLYYQRTVKATMGETLVKYNLLEKSDIFFQAGYDIHRFLMFMGLLGIYWLVSKSKDSDHKWIMMFLLFIITIFSFGMYFVFHITAALLLLFITKEYYKLCFRKSKKAVSKHAHLNFVAFVTLLISQIIFIFVWLDLTLYVVAEIMQLIGFIIFLINIIMLVFGYGKKKD